MPKERPEVPAQLKLPPKLDTSMPLAFPATVPHPSRVVAIVARHNWPGKSFTRSLLLSAGQPPGRVVFQVFLDEADQVCGDASGTPYGRRILARHLDAELTDYLGGGDLLIFQ